MQTYAIQTIGCQMNAADSDYVAAALAGLGLRPTDDLRRADVVVLNTCVVREHAERKCYGRLHLIGSLKRQRPEMIVALMGCLVGVRRDRSLEERFPFVDIFLAPSEYEPLVALVRSRLGTGQTPEGCARPVARHGRVTAFVPAVAGCSHTCAFCVIPYRRGPEKSRPPDEILDELRRLAAAGVVEVTLLGQIIDRYGMDLGPDCSLPRLLEQAAGISGLQRIRFLTSHPSWMTPEIIATVARHPRICPQFEIAVQSGNDEILQRMRRGHTVDDFRRIVESIRRVIPEAAIHTDVIVGFPGETEAQFDDTCRLLQELELDKVHVAAYSERPGTFAARHYTDDVPPDQKKRRLKTVEDLQRGIQLRKNRALVGRTVEILVEEKRRDRWYGRTRCNRIVFASNGGTGDLRGKLIPVRITGAGPYSLTGEIASGGPC